MDGSNLVAIAVIVYFMDGTSHPVRVTSGMPFEAVLASFVGLGFIVKLVAEGRIIQTVDELLGHHHAGHTIQAVKTQAWDIHFRLDGGRTKSRFYAWMQAWSSARSQGGLPSLALGNRSSCLPAAVPSSPT